MPQDEDIDVLFEQGQEYIKQKRWKEAVSVYKRLSEVAPEEAGAHNGLGVAYFQLEEYALAVPALTNSLLLNNHPEGNFILAQCYLNLDDYEQSLVFFNFLSEIQPEDWRGYHGVALSLFALKRYEEALVAIAKAEELNPENLGVIDLRALILKDSGRHAEAISAYQELIQFDPTDSDSHFNLGLIYFGENRYTEAEEAFQAVLQLSPDHSDALHALGMMYAGWKKIEEAIEICNRLTTISPDKAEGLKQYIVENIEFLESVPRILQEAREASKPAPQTSEDFEAIQLLAEEFWEQAQNAPRWHTPFGDEITIIAGFDDRLEKQGLKVLRLLEDEHKKFPDNRDIAIELCTFHAKMGQFYFNAVSPTLLVATDSELTDLMSDLDVSYDTIGKIASIQIHTRSFTEKACSHFIASASQFDYIPAVFILADIFRIAGFYGTALHWYDVVLKYAAEQDLSNDGIAAKVRARRLDLRSEGKTTDPLLSTRKGGLFPRKETPGLQLDLQTAAEEKAHQATVEAERKQQEAQERKRQEEQQRQAQERQQRISAGQCVNCGKPLGFMDKMAKRQTHSKC